MRTTTIAAMAAVLLSPLARADKFHFGEAPKHPVEGSEPAVIEGVLVSEDAYSFHIRVLGGQITIERRLVTSVEKDGLTIAELERQEAAAQRRWNQAERQRAEAQEADAQRARAEATDATMSRQGQGGQDQAPAQASQPEVLVPVEPVYDPVLHTATGSQMGDRRLLRELEFAYGLTHDHRYIKLIRRLRRM
jgi:hypothetical protein